MAKKVKCIWYRDHDEKKDYSLVNYAFGICDICRMKARKGMKKYKAPKPRKRRKKKVKKKTK